MQQRGGGQGIREKAELIDVEVPEALTQRTRGLPSLVGEFSR